MSLSSKILLFWTVVVDIWEYDGIWWIVRCYISLQSKSLICNSIQITEIIQWISNAGDREQPWKSGSSTDIKPKLIIHHCQHVKNGSSTFTSFTLFDRFHHCAIASGALPSPSRPSSPFGWRVRAEDNLRHWVSWNSSDMTKKN